MGQQVFFALASFLIIGSVFHGSEGYAKSPSPRTSVLSPVGGRTPSFGFNGKPPRSNAWSPTSPVKGSVPLLIQGLAAIVPEHSLSRYIHKDDKRSKWISPTIDNHIPQSPIGEDPPLQPVSISPSVNDKRYGMPTAAPPVEIVNHLSPSYHSPTKGSPPVMPIAPHVGLKSPENSSPASGPVPKLRATEGIHSPAPATLSPPSIIFHTHRRKKRTSIPASSPLNAIPPPPYQQDPPLHPVSISPSLNDKRNGMPIASPPVEIVNHLSPSYHSPTEGSPPLMSIAPHVGLKSPNNSSPASSPVTKLRATEGIHSPAPAPLSPPSIIFHMHKRKKRTSIPASAPLNAIPPPYQQDPPLQPVAISPSVNDKRYGMPTAAPPVEIVNHLSPSYHSPTKGSPPVMPIAPHVGLKSPVNSSPASGPVPKLRATEGVHSPAPPPPLIFHSHQRKKRISSPASAPLNVIPPPYQQDPPLHPVSISPSVNDKRNGMPIASPPVEIVNHLSPSYHSPTKGPVDYPQSPSHPPTVLPKKSRQRYHGYPPIVQGPSTSAIEPPFFPTVKEGVPAPSPSVTIPSRPTQRAPSPSLTVQGPPRLIQGPSLSTVQPPFSPTVKQGMPAPSPLVTIHFRPTERAPSPSIAARYGPTKGAPSPSLRIPSRPIERPILSPEISPSIFPMTRKMPVAAPVRALPPPPPNQDCLSLTCMEPLTNTPPGSPCACVLPMQVGLRLSVALYTFFPLVSELAQEIATAIFMKQSQVRIMGANAASQEPDKTIVLINLVPLGQKFDNTTAFLTYEKFWHKQVPINTSFFGDYEVLYIHYPGLPPSPPSAPSSITVTGEQLPNGNNGRTIQPLGVDVMKRKERLGISLIAIIVLSSAIALVLCAGTMWLLLWKCGRRSHQPSPSPRASAPLPKPSGPGSVAVGSWPSSAASASISFSSSIAAYTGTAKTFSIGEIEKATDNFDASRILGEGGFGCVYRGILEDGTRVAVKVLKRDDQQGSREFLAEVEMLGRLHHRNLVKLIGICTEEHSRCLVYELIPNGSVESHLHGVDKEMAPLDWSARMKIALGSARGLAYLHEDSNPRVIHRDFKSSNILLEYDFTPKVSDFGLARTALDGRNDHISTRVMGTFGYVAPEYAMTGHLLVKSDVYSYGVVLLELLTGRKPVDMSQPAGQENLVAWARPLLTSKEGLEMIIDPALGSNFPFDSVAKVAAIASMCVQREVSNRPFMGEVVQALKLVCNENDEKQGESGSFSHEGSSVQDVEIQVSNASGQLPVARSFLTADYDSGLETERALSTSAIFSRQESQYFTRHSSSGPLKIGNYVQSWQGGVPGGSVSEHGSALKLWEVLDNKERWP